MKKIFIILPLILIMTSCAAEPAPIQKEFSAIVTSEYNGIKIKAEVKPTNHTLIIKLKSPESLKGCTYTYRGSDLTVEYNELKLNAECGYLPENAFPNIIYNVLETVNSGETVLSGKYNNNALYSGKSNSGEFTLTCDCNTGYISELELKDFKFSADFENK